jgi:hypothetical protein
MVVSPMTTYRMIAAPARVPDVIVTQDTTISLPAWASTVILRLAGAGEGAERVLARVAPPPWARSVDVSVGRWPGDPAHDGWVEVWWVEA